ncbi:hypothetical protein VRU48_16760 [Pedobacter sp. KR3-3]|uniref:Uncharacterized protein n=1 Tax=Pedobacter albus TaxID=3113905 RepID=A0ABU7IBD2_9SPHI|nr:hypothetical protein [Pedobacter sp. KR3-3]MEE1946778.1 hypothetical protein [Pedobacter sp. KR3-3]
MKQRFGKLFILMPIGLLLISAALVAFVSLKISDGLLGFIMGIGIGLALLPFVILKLKPNNY